MSNQENIQGASSERSTSPPDLDESKQKMTTPGPSGDVLQNTSVDAPVSKNISVPISGSMITTPGESGDRSGDGSRNPFVMTQTNTGRNEWENTEDVNVSVSAREAQPIRDSSSSSSPPVSPDHSLHPSQEPSGPFASNNLLATSLSEGVRDASCLSGLREADDAYNRFFLEYYPDYKEEVYKVPPTFLGHHPYSPKGSSKLKSSLKETVYLYEQSTSDVLGDRAEKIVADSIEILLKHLVEDKHPAFLITSYKFENFCNKTNSKPFRDENRYLKKSTDQTVTKVKIKDGDHDLVIIHKKLGVIFIEVKGCKAATNPYKATKKAIEQTEKDTSFFSANFDDLQLGVTVKTAVALPDILREDLDKKYKHCSEQIEKFCSDAGTKCLFMDEMLNDGSDWKEKLLIWWSHITRDSTGFKSFEDYKRVVARYVGFKSTVPIPMIHHHDQSMNEGRTLQRCVIEIGNRYANIVLTPDQVFILNKELPRLIIRGNYGTGKTVLLILKVRALLREMRSICVISMCQSPLINLLEESIKYDLDPIYYEKITFETATDQKKLIDVLEKCKHERRDVFVDEFPTFTDCDKSLCDTVQGYPPEQWFWCIMARERDSHLSSKVREIFSSENMKVGFLEVVMTKILRCPPTIHSLLPCTPKQVLYQDPPEEFGSNAYRKYITPILTRHFHSLGLIPTNSTGPFAGSSSDIQRQWSDVVVLDCEEMPLLSKIKKLDIPYTRKNSYPRSEALYVITFDGSEGFKPVARFRKHSCCSVYMKGENTTEKIDMTKDSILKFLYMNGFLNPKIREKFAVVGSNISPRNWSDIIFVEKRMFFSVLKELGVPLIEPWQIDGKIVNKVLYTNRNDFQGFHRRENITFQDGRAIANADEPICIEGPEVIFVEHKLKCNSAFSDCSCCERQLREVLENLGLAGGFAEGGQSLASGHLDHATLESTTERHNPVQQNVQHIFTESHDLTYADVVILEERPKPEGAVDFFKRCGIPVVNKLNSTSIDVTEMYSPSSVLYIKPCMFTGLEKKVVIVMRSKSHSFLSPIRSNTIQDTKQLSVTRYTSQLIIITL